MSRSVVNQSPTRKTLVTGESLPSLTTESRPVPLGRDEDGETDAAVRAFAVLIRNRSDRPVYVREGATDDENRIDAGEVFQIWEPNGTNRVFMRGEEGGETVEFRTLEAHNDFDLTDKIDAFARALSHFFGTSTRNTSITNIGDSITIDDIEAAAATFDIAGSVDIDNFGDTVTVDDIEAGEIQLIDSDGNTLDIDGDGRIVVGDITAASASFDGDITGQNDFDLSVFSRTGREKTAYVNDSDSLVDFNSQVNEYVSDFAYYEFIEDAEYDGYISQFTVRLYDDSSGGGIDRLGAILEIDTGDGYERMSPEGTGSVRSVVRFYDEADFIAVQTNDEDTEVAYTYDPKPALKFQKGDSVRLRFGANDAQEPSNTSEIEVEAVVRYTLIQNQ